MKCPKKHVKDDFVMWWHLPIYLKCPKIEEFHFRFLFGFKIDHVSFIWNDPFLYLRNIWKMAHFRKVGHSKILARDQFWNRKGIENGMGHSKILCKCYHMTKSSFTCFLGHFMLPPVISYHYINYYDYRDFKAYTKPNS